MLRRRRGLKHSVAQSAIAVESISDQWPVAREWFLLLQQKTANHLLICIPTFPAIEMQMMSKIGGGEIACRGIGSRRLLGCRVGGCPNNVIDCWVLGLVR
ncbi:hypothetical protein CEXT_689511 [Caerostris extrusa]|uniref:Uncharacterized protein n=1 Tax=Caerostris extrusa TaxID=172846 RepID=A0AAV4VQ34_CAEEX|nr:hypothetical protein CEXT_689511 [Caerostris extrusa]